MAACGEDLRAAVTIVHHRRSKIPRAHLKKSIVEGVCGVRVVVSSLPRKALREANFLADLNAPHN